MQLIFGKGMRVTWYEEWKMMADFDRPYISFVLPLMETVMCYTY